MTRSIARTDDRVCSLVEEAGCALHDKGTAGLCSENGQEADENFHVAGVRVECME
jgi:hypothetical protein